MSLDSSDDDPGRFIPYLIAALQKVDANLGQEIEGIIRSSQLPPSEIIGATLINDILAYKGRFLLVLDDFHVIQDHFILQVFEQLVANFPHPLHLVLITREDPPLPLARLRASNQLTEIRAKDLRFSHRDIDHFLNEVMGLSLSQADIAALESKTEGWIIGLQLAGLSIQNQEEPSSFIASLSGSHRHILGYFTEQVLNRQPEEIRSFLLQTSILDKLKDDLCDTVTGRSDSRALLERSFNANLFLLPLDDEGQWYRYHPMFADLLSNLQNTIQKDKTADLHRRASRWYAQAGMTGEAIQHALSAEDYAMAVDLLESHALGMIMQGFVKTVNGWAQAIPDEWAWQSPKTNLAFTWMHLLRGDYAQTSLYLERLRMILEGLPVESYPREDWASLKAEWLAMQSLMLYRQGKVTESKTMAAEALEIAPEQNSGVRSLAYYALASACLLMEDYPNAVDAYRLSIHLGRAGKNPMAEMMSTSGLAGMVLEHGQLCLAFEIASQAVDRIERSGVLPPISAVMYATLGGVYSQWHQIEEARRYLLRALHLSTLGGSRTATLFCHVLLARLFLIEGNLESAASEIQKAADLIPVGAPEYIEQEVVSQQVRIYLAQNRPTAAEMALQRHGVSFGEQFAFPNLLPDESISYSLGLLYNSSLHFLLYQVRAGGDPTSLKTGVKLADCLIHGAFKGRQLLVALETLLLRAQMQAALGDSQNSQADYVKALELAEPEGFIGVFVEGGLPIAKALADLVRRSHLGSVHQEYVERILGAFSGSHPPCEGYISAETRPAVLTALLTSRELEVLRLMAKGLKYKEIAARLFISQNTVRFHIKAIYGKLDANNRTQAIERARQLRIL